MIKPVTVAMVCILAIPAQAQTLGDDVVSQYAELMKAKAAIRRCMSEEGSMQIARNEHYDALLRAKAKNPGAPTIDEMFEVQAQLRSEDDALSEKRDECMPLFDQLAAAARELRRGCSVYAAPSSDGEPTETDALATDICHGSASKTDASKSETH